MAKTRGGRRAPRGHGINRTAPSTALHSPSSASLELQVDACPIVTESENANTRSVRGTTCGKGVRKTMKSAKHRLRVEFDFQVRQAICDNAETFTNEIGYIVRNNCSLQYKEWRLVPSNVRAPLREKLLKAWRSYKYKLHAHFKQIGGDEDPAKAKSTVPDDVKKEDWEYLCDIWADNVYKERAKKNAQSRVKRKWESRNGSKSTARHHLARGFELDAPTGQIETWRIRHWHSENGWSSPESEAKYEEMMQLRRDNPPETMTDKMILEKVLGRQSNRLSGWGRSPSKSQGTCSEGSTRSTYNQTLNELKECRASHEALKHDFQKLQQVLIDSNIIPQSSLLRAPSDHCSGASHLDSSPSDDHGYFSHSDS